jgi:hypothetical protein
MTLVYECSIGGIDPGGFSFENVFHISSTYAGGDTTFTTAGHLITFLESAVLGAYVAAMNNQSKILEISARCINPIPDFTRLRPEVMFGGRVLTPAIGAVCGRLVFLPTAAPLHVSSMFIPNGCEGDYIVDLIQAAYSALLDDLGDAFIGIDGSEPTYEWQLIQWHRKTSDAADIDQFYTSPNPTTLNKRIRA